MPRRSGVKRRGAGERTRNGITIGRLASLIGLAPSAMRYYEGEGLVAPAKQDRNSYRRYTPAESCALLMARRYRSLGLDLKRTARLLAEGAPEALASALAERESELESEAARIERARRALGAYRAEVEVAMRQGESLAEARLPAMKYVFTIDSGYALDDPARSALVRSWMEALPCVSYSLVIPRRAFLGLEDLSCRWGFGIEAESLEPPERGIAESFPAADCLALSFLRQEAGTLEPGEVSALRDRFAASGLELAGDPRGTFLGILGAKEEPRYLYRIYMPVYR